MKQVRTQNQDNSFAQFFLLVVLFLLSGYRSGRDKSRAGTVALPAATYTITGFVNYV